ncbi:MAG: hypothetical protein EBE86_026590 [Hormoscilla sp. GUM202]|nr:hypothetical protein [Hormoscilla sp. GUM202]
MNLFLTLVLAARNYSLSCARSGDRQFAGGRHRRDRMSDCDEVGQWDHSDRVAWRQP